MSGDRDIGETMEVETARTAGVLSTVKLAARCAPVLLAELSERHVGKLLQAQSLGEFRLYLENSVPDNDKIIDIYRRMAIVVDVLVPAGELCEDTQHWLSLVSRSPVEEVIEAPRKLVLTSG